ncbi:MAG: hypothetical protein NT074_07250 [Methanomicrobiales archaeon]|nr:hypothetical protein [Methanomicrobiales archaeon]
MKGPTARECRKHECPHLRRRIPGVSECAVSRKLPGNTPLFPVTAGSCEESP